MKVQRSEDRRPASAEPSEYWVEIFAELRALATTSRERRAVRLVAAAVSSETPLGSNERKLGRT
jgi:hypothetical protein